MRPINLVMQAFGPFPSKVEIPFSRLGQGNIYLISGITGSGKTTIFDAICYALFNSSSGSIRGVANLKSHYAKDDAMCFVQFDFLFNGEKYSIIRHPSYERKKSRGEGVKIEPAKAQITLPNGKIIEKVKDVDEYIVNLLGLNVTQFSQIALLAQGEFLKLLNSDTQSRTEVFRNIFKTWNYANFQIKLKEKTSEYKNQYDSLEASLIQYINDVISSDDEKLTFLKQKYVESSYFDKLDEFIELLNSQNKIDSEKLKLVEKDILKLQAEIKNIDNSIQKILAKTNLIDKKNSLNSEIDKAKTDFSLIKTKFDNLNQERKNLEDLAIKIEKSQDNYNKIIESKKILDLKEKANKSIEEIKSEIDLFEKELAKNKQNFVQTQYNTYSLLENDLEELQKQFLTLEKKTNEKLIIFNKNNSEFLKMQAGILASNLKDNEPCPVCGALQHPNLAKILNSDLTQEFLDELKLDYENSNNDLVQKSQECSVLKEKIKFIFLKYKELSKKYEINIEEKFNKTEKQDYEKNILDIEQNLKDKNSSLVQYQNEVKIYDSKIDNLLKDIKNSDIDTFTNEFNELKKQYNNQKNNIEIIEKEYLQRNILLNNLLANLKLIDEQISGFSDIDINNLEEFKSSIAQLQDELQILEKNNKNIYARKLNNDKVLDILSKKYNEFLKISNNYSNYKTLSDCANGNLKGKVRIAFEQYIQGYYLDLVLNEANKHLKIMTQNQYQLLRKKDETSMQTKTGLDLEVMDFHTYKKRSTKTLSGGESFKASLALALGLSDCVSNFSGAINIDAMFIDEGFGTLDSESLELAMEVIFNLSTNNRLIGIISHIEELKTKIQNQILAIKTNDGSFLEINF